MATYLEKQKNFSDFRKKIMGSTTGDFTEAQIGDISGNETGIDRGISDYKQEIIPFDKYRIRVILTSSNEFVGIDAVEIDKNFLSFKQKIANRHFHDVENFYRDE